MKGRNYDRLFADPVTDRIFFTDEMLKKKMETASSLHFNIMVSGSMAVALLLDPGALTTPGTEVVQFCTTNLTYFVQYDGLDVG